MIRFSSVRRLLGFAAFALSVLVPMCAAPHSAPDSAWKNLPPHPRLFANAEQWQVLRTRLALTTSESAAADSVSARLFALIRARAEAVLKLPPVKITGSSRRGQALGFGVGERPE